jgi:hypothetical protein
MSSFAEINPSAPKPKAKFNHLGKEPFLLNDHKLVDIQYVWPL